MKQRISKIFLVLLTLCMVLGCMAGCKDEKPQEQESVDPSLMQGFEDTRYNFPTEIKLKDGELNFFNFEAYYNCILYIDVDSYTDNISQAVFERNAAFEEKYKVLVMERKYPFTGRNETFSGATKELQALQQAGDDQYDAIYVSLYDQSILLSSGALRNLCDVEGLNLNSEWWDQQLTNSYMFADGSCYVASSPLNLMSYETTYVNFFNPDIADERNIENMFNLVRNGTWTIEKMLTIIQDSGVITTNTDGSYTYVTEDTGFYGISVHSQSPMRFLRGANVSFVNQNDKGSYRFICSDTDRFSRVSDLLLRLFDRSMGMAVGVDKETDPVNYPEGYVAVFNSEKSLFLNAELKCGMTLKKFYETEIEYSILPMPKYDEAQTGYVSECSNQCLLLAIPTLNSDAAMAGVAIDALSYMSYRDVLPTYYNDYISHRGLNDSNSLEMLNSYIMPGRCIELGQCYGWTTPFISGYNSLIRNAGVSEGVTLATIIQTQSRTINATIKSFFGE